jgi:1-aminocyclopropane-1-carboxylate deaminase/D-cysteine desulfhydrase-like pyridoxal-dependent ACC family enzyme
MSARAEPSLFAYLAGPLPWRSLGAWPTQVEPIARHFPELAAPRLFIKRDDESSTIYGGTKVRALEPLLGAAHASGAHVVVASGACGSSSLLAATLHAKKLGLASRAVGYPQPASSVARDNVRRVLAACDHFVMLPHWSLVPLALARERAIAFRSAEHMAVLPPALMSSLGALGYVSAGLELAEQVGRGELEAPDNVVIGIGSACTAAGLLLGFWLAEKLELVRFRMPRVVAVRVAPWPLASAEHAVRLSLAASALLMPLLERPCEPPSWRELRSHLVVDGSQLGAGYGLRTSAGSEAIARHRDARLPALDEIYGAKIAAGFFDWVRGRPHETTLLWATTSSAELSAPAAPRAAVPWLLARFLREKG